MQSHPHQPTYPRWFLACLIALGVAVLVGGFADAQAVKKDDAKKAEAKKDEPKKEEPKKEDAKKDAPATGGGKERFEVTTDDGVEIVLDYYPPPAAKGKNAPVVILVHAIGPGMEKASRKDWEKFPDQIQAKGYAVVTFDFRGYGESKKIKRTELYWNVPAAGLIGPHLPKRSFAPTRPPTAIDLRDYRTTLELAQLGNDLIAIKKWLHLKNNAQELNSGNVIVVGAEQGASLAVLWIYNEFVIPNRARSVGKTEGDDISCVVWVSMHPVLANSRIEPTIEKCLQDMRDRFPTLAIYGKLDTNRDGFWKKALRYIKPKDQDVRFKGTGAITIDNTKLAGTKLLGNDAFGTEKDILNYIEKYKSDTLWQEKKLIEQPTLFVTRNLALPG